MSTADGGTATYDLLIGADGLHSAVRKAIGIDVEPRSTGMGIWRAFVERPEDVVRTDLTYGGPCFIAGYCPTGPDTIYAYLVEKAQERKQEDGPRIMAELAAAYGGPWNEIRANLDHSARINYTWFTTHLVDGPWNRGRTRHHRRRRPQLPAHGGPGRGHGLGRRSRPGRTADQRRRSHRDPAGRSSPTAAWTGPRQWSTPRSSWASGCSTASATPTCPA